MEHINSILRTLCLMALMCMTSVNASAYKVYDDSFAFYSPTSSMGNERILVIDRDIETKSFATPRGEYAYIIKPGVTVAVTNDINININSKLYVFGTLLLKDGMDNQSNNGTIYIATGGTLTFNGNFRDAGKIENVSPETILTKAKLSGQKPEPGKPGWKDCWAKGISESNDFGPVYCYEDEELKNEITDFETWKTNAGKITAQGTTEWVDGQFPDSEHNYVGWKGYCKFTYEDNGEEAYYEDIDYINKIEDLETWKRGKGSLTLVKVNGQEPTVENDGWRDYYELTEGNVTTTYYEDEACEIKIEDIEEWKNGEGKLCVLQLGDKQYIHNGKFIKDDVCFEDKVAYDLNVNLDVTGKITYSRTFNNTNWQPLYVPFAISYDKWKGNFDVAAINNFHEYTDDMGQTVKTELEIRMVKSGTLKPNHPYLIKAHSANATKAQEINISSNKMYKSEENSIVCSSVERKYTFTGTYRDITGMRTKDYIFLSDGSLCRATDDNVKLSAQRWYLSIESLGSQVDGGNTSDVKAMEFDIKLLDDEATGIDEITVTRTPLRNSVEAIYNLNGMRVNDSYKGIVIKNGKKVLQK